MKPTNTERSENEAFYSYSKPELVAPAGNREAAYAAFYYGADAIYIGLKDFSARADAENFDVSDAEEIIAFAHAQIPSKRVFVAINTLVKDREIEDVINLLQHIELLGADAVIVQDIGIIEIVRKYFPSLRIHVSTQAAIHNSGCAKAFAELGCKRIVLARELTLEEVKSIREKTNIEIEAFVHGALCYSYSGLCLFSSHKYGRSGNRGRCAYCCREMFYRENERNEPSLPFSMKDFAAGEYLTRLCTIGVSALKIEGRMKSPLYVAAVTDYYRRMLDKKMNKDEKEKRENEIKTIFSRPWTSFYLEPDKNEMITDPVNVGHRGTLIGEVGKIIKDKEIRMKLGP